MDVAVELVQHDDQRQARQGLLLPASVRSGDGGIDHRSETIPDQRVGRGVDALPELVAVGQAIRLHGQFAEPEFDDVPIVCRWPVQFETRHTRRKRDSGICRIRPVAEQPKSSRTADDDLSRRQSEPERSISQLQGPGGLRFSDSVDVRRRVRQLAKQCQVVFDPQFRARLLEQLFNVRHRFEGGIAIHVEGWNALFPATEPEVIQIA